MFIVVPVPKRNFHVGKMSNQFNTISAHVLDTMKGLPAKGLDLKLEFLKNISTQQWEECKSATTNSDGKVLTTEFPKLYNLGTYRITYDTAKYFQDNQISSFFFPSITVLFHIKEPWGQHYHVPLLLSPFGYSTYRGS